MDGIADYELVRSLGSGNYGEFFLATPPPRLHIDVDYVVVKVLVTAGSDSAFNRAMRELRIFAQVNSPNLVTLYDAGQDGDSFFYAMEYCSGGSLAHPTNPTSTDLAISTTAGAARAAHDLHEAGIAHRDITPANVLIADSGAKLADLGLAQFLSPGYTVTGMGSVGSVEFMDPLVIKGGRADRASDIWSLGATLHRAITGRGIYGELPDADPVFCMRRVLTGEPSIDPSLTPEVALVIRDCLARSPVDRPLTAAVVATRLDAITSL